MGRIFGYEPAELLGLRSALEIVHPADRDRARDLLRRRTTGEIDDVRYTWRGLRKDGNVLHIETLARRTLFAGRPATSGSLIDVTERYRFEQELAEREARLRTLIETTPDVVFTSDLDGRITSMNPAGERMAGLPGQSAIGRHLAELIDPAHADNTRDLVRRTAEGHEGTYELPIQTPTGSVMLELRLRLVHRDGQPVELMGVGRDITVHKQKEEALRSLTLEDELTGLYNRRGFLTLAERHLKLAVRRKIGLLLLFCDVDGLKVINDTFGHAAGDRAIIAAADLLRRSFRSADIIARLGGDEFTVFPLEAAGNSAQLLMERLAFNVDGYNEASGEPFKLALSAGVSRFDPDSSWTIQQLLDEADRQLYESRRARRR
jgi:diguanylate cyclase (GGDEF)-like protein/PAS domain S-box-containing protein